MSILWIALLTFFASATMKLECPCILSAGQGSSVTFDYGIISTDSVSQMSGLELQLVHAPTSSLFTSTNIYEGFYVVGSSALSELQCSDQTTRIKSAISLSGAGLESGFLLMRLISSSGETLDVVNLGVDPISWTTDGVTI